MRDPNRAFDLTCLHVIRDSPDKPIHRDYAAHFFRWGFLGRLIEQEKTRMLDIGCGADAPIPNILHWRRNILPKSYLGVDMNKKIKMPGFKWCEGIAAFNFAERWKELRPRGPFDLITCLEVVEHMRITSVRALLRGAAALLAPGGRLALSTPVANGHPAKNHINEMTVAALQKEMEDAGWRAEKRFGTFMNVNEIKKCAGPAEYAVAMKLREYYSDEVISCFLAPLHPNNARNNIWICSLDTDDLL